MSERTDALKLAHRLLDEPNADPDDDLRTLARQLVRATERCEAMHRKLREVNWEDVAMRDMIQANRDEILRKHEEAIRRIRKAATPDNFGYGAAATAGQALKNIRKIIEALYLFHPMHAESWPGWPEGS